MIQLKPPLPVTTPRGKALAHVLIDLGPEHDLQWVCFQDDGGECWTWSNRDIRAQARDDGTKDGKMSERASKPDWTRPEIRSSAEMKDAVAGDWFYRAATDSVKFFDGVEWQEIFAQ